jgi:hypothetical protein
VTKKLLLIISTICVLLFWTQGGFDSVYLTTDLGRDLSQLSNLWIGKSIIWLGPRLSLGFPTSPIYYYIFYPALAIARGNAEALIVFNLLIAGFALAVFSWFSSKKYDTKASLGIILLGLMPWWINIAMVPGNGSTYVLWLVISLTLLWFELPIFYAALFLGLSISFHPAAMVALPILIYEWLRRGKSLKTMLLSIVALILPWAPIIIFEFITKGFLTRSFLANPSAGFFKVQPGLTNILGVVSSLGLNLILAIAILIPGIIYSAQRARIWIILGILSLAAFGLFTRFPAHYLIGIAAVLGFILVIGLVESFGKSTIAKIILVLLLVNNVSLFSPRAPAERTISKIETVVNTYITSQKPGKDKKIAVVAALGPDAASPQADDYRYFFRIKGYNALEVVDYGQADVLIEFIESPGFNWQNWSTWETNQFGKRGAGSEFNTQDVKVITYTK